MALLMVLAGPPMDTLCSSGQGAPLNGMVMMYLLMSALHLPPWLNLISARHRQARGPQARDVLFAPGGTTMPRIEHVAFDHSAPRRA
jgi:hypothetical protein